MSREENEAQGEEKFCWICYQTADDLPLLAPWTNPCKCRGSLKWVHRKCLQIWIETRRRAAPDHVPACGHCGHVYAVNSPYANFRWLEHLYVCAEDFSNVYAHFLSLVGTFNFARDIAVIFRGMTDDVIAACGNNSTAIGNFRGIVRDVTPWPDVQEQIVAYDFSVNLFDEFTFVFSILCVPLWIIETEATDFLLRYNNVVQGDDAALAFFRDNRSFGIVDFLKSSILAPVCAQALGKLFFVDTSEWAILKAFCCTSIVLISKIVVNVAVEYFRVARSKNMLILDYEENNNI